jgi:MFS family permease
MAETATSAPAASPKIGLRDVFAVGEYRAVWFAQLASFAGDQFAQIALAILVYDRTHSPLLAAVVFAATTGAMAAGGLLLSWTADRYPRRTVMITADLACLSLVLVMTIPGVPLGVLIALLFAVSLAIEPFLAARMATNRVALGPERFQAGVSVTLTTYQVAQLVGLAAGGTVTVLVGVRGALLIDASSFAVSALIIAVGVKARPAPPREPGRPQVLAGIRQVFTRPVARTATLLIWLAMFYAAPAGVAVPLGRQLGHGPAVVGWLLAAMTAGAAVGLQIWPKLTAGDRRTRFAAVSAAAACGVLMLFALPVTLAGALAVFAASGLCTGYVATANDVLFGVIPDEHCGKASGVVGAGISLGQAIGVVVAGAAAQRLSPAVVLAGCGVAGTCCAVPLVVSWRRNYRSGLG